MKREATEKLTRQFYCESDLSRVLKSLSAISDGERVSGIVDTRGLAERDTRVLGVFLLASIVALASRLEIDA